MTSFILLLRYEYSFQKSIQIHSSILQRFWIDLKLNFIIAMSTDVLKTKCL